MDVRELRKGKLDSGLGSGRKVPILGVGLQGCVALSWLMGMSWR